MGNIERSVQSGGGVPYNAPSLITASSSPPPCIPVGVHKSTCPAQGKEKDVEDSPGGQDEFHGLELFSLSITLFSLRPAHHQIEKEEPLLHHSHAYVSTLPSVGAKFKNTEKDFCSS
ncbi:hypothetical protein DAPPUDRAFT_100733 [Daphnia pulex]|uniref:Uncharacterized protein n=1 Tax=Daphnia pulex TaxID=6669 RepID=E9GB82_DAPPU|nr:hypothetical protein DAPPUDRAFT_100733 [Daphnia pulex]|eukprot:EFX83405.1 hypothetical protein DAPPUDRAFT_100733 [Daphnia pulex]